MLKPSSHPTERLFNQMMVAAAEVLGIDYELPELEVMVLPPYAAGCLDLIDFPGRAVLIINSLNDLLGYTVYLPVHVIIAHEMIHYQQYMSGRLYHASDVATRQHLVIWEGKEYRSVNPLDRNLPWEAEAYGAMRVGVRPWSSSTRPRKQRDLTYHKEMDREVFHTFVAQHLLLRPFLSSARFHGLALLGLLGLGDRLRYLLPTGREEIVTHR